MPAKTKRAGIASLASTAKTADDYQVLLNRVQGDLDEAENHISELEARRNEVVLNGEDIDAYHRDLLIANEKVKTLTAAVDTVTRQYEKALEAEAKANLEKQAADVRAKAVPAYQEALSRLHDAMEQVLSVCADVEAYRAEIDGVNDLAERRNRPDLRISVAQVRSEMVAKLAGPAGEYRLPKIEQMEGETDEAFELRLGNAREAVSRKANLADPIREAGTRAINAIQANAFEMGPHERSRNMRVVRTESTIGPDGQRVLIERNLNATLGEPGAKRIVQEIKVADTRPEFGIASSGNGITRGTVSGNA